MKNTPTIMSVYMAIALSCSSSAFKGKGGESGASLPPVPTPEPTVGIKATPTIAPQQTGNGINTQQTSIEDRCDKPAGQALPSLRVIGDDVWPIDVDYDDYTLNLSGQGLLFDVPTGGAGFKIGSHQATQVTVNYQKGSTTCQHRFQFTVKICPNQKSTVIAGPFVLDGSSQTSLTFPLGRPESFVDITFTATCKSAPPYTYGLYGFPGAMLAK